MATELKNFHQMYPKKRGMNFVRFIIVWVTCIIYHIIYELRRILYNMINVIPNRGKL